jgi:HlyD family secretion protein
VKSDEKNRQVWVLRGGKPVSVSIEAGLSNGRHTEVLGGELQPGMAVITGTQKTAK